jgi:hypothetical protein
MFSTQDKTLGSMITARQATPTFRSSGKNIQRRESNLWEQLPLFFSMQ